MSDNLPPSDGPEYLDQGSGAPIDQEQRRSGKKPLLIGAAALAGAMLVGGGVFAAVQLSGGGEQPSEALPADTLGYLSFDLDPSASQKIEAIKMFRKFPTLRDELGMEEDTDLRKRLFEEAQSSGSCEGIDYEEDIEPWLGERVAIAGVEIEGEPAPVGVIAVSDGDAAEQGVEKLRAECGGGSAEDAGAYVVSDGWMVVAETEKIAEAVIDRTAEGTLADDDDFVRWTDEVGDPGIVTMYAAPEAGELMATAAGSGELADLTGSDSGSLYSDEELAQLKEDLIASGMTDDAAQEYVDDLSGDTAEGVDAEELQSQMTTALEDFKGMGGTLRFDEGAVELEIASETATTDGLRLGDQGASLVGSLPADTVAAFGLSMPEGWAQAYLDQMEKLAGEDVNLDEFVQQAEDETGLELPEDLETLTGEAMAVSLGGDFDPESAANSSDLSQVPMGVKVQGDKDAIEDLLNEIRDLAQLGEDGPLKSKAEGDIVAISPSTDYLDALVEDGDLADSEVYSDVLGENDDAGMVMFVNFNGADNWLVELAGNDSAAKENLEPLAGMGMTAWMDDSVSHVNVRLTTD